MDWLPPIEVSRISDGGKVRPHKVLNALRKIQISVRVPSPLEYQKESFPFLLTTIFLK